MMSLAHVYYFLWLGLYVTFTACFVARVLIGNITKKRTNRIFEAGGMQNSVLLQGGFQFCLYDCLRTN
jgi:hypothetical protein